MVPVSWALASAEVNAGTASAAKIAIIAITTSNSISVNAEKNFFVFIFIVGFFSCGCSEGFYSEGAVSPYGSTQQGSYSSQRGWFSVCSGVFLKDIFLKCWLLFSLLVPRVLA